MAIFTNTIEYSITDLGFTKLLTKASPVQDITDVPPELANVFTSGVAPKSLIGGELVEEVNMVSGFLQSSNFESGSTGWQLTPTSAELNVSTALASLDIPDTTTANSFHVDSDGNMWLGATTFAAAPGKFSNAGVLTATGAVIDGTSTIGGRTASILSGAIDASGDLVNDVINARLDSSSKQILSDFDFGSSDYAGALKAGDITWNTSDGTITGGSGVVVYRGGIVAANTGVATFTLDATTGDATFAGTLSAAAGTLGTITAGTFTGVSVTASTLQSATSGSRFVVTSATQRLDAINANGDINASINWSDTTAAILKLAPIHDARRALEFIIPASFAGAGAASDANAITIDNAADSISIDITDGGSVGLQIADCDTSAIKVIRGATNAATVDLTGASGSYPVIDINQNGTATNSYGIRITQGTDAVKAGIFIENNANSTVGAALEIDRNGNHDNQVISAVEIESSNLGVGGKATGINFSNATIYSVMQVAIDNTDPTGSGGAATGRIPILVGNTLRYIAYY